MSLFLKVVGAMAILASSAAVTIDLSAFYLVSPEAWMIFIQPVLFFGVTIPCFTIMVIYDKVKNRSS